MSKRRKLCQVLFGGLGGHASVAFSLLQADYSSDWVHCLLFLGTESVTPDSRQKCMERQLEFAEVSQVPGRPLKAWLNLFLQLQKQRPDCVLLHSISAILPAKLYCVLHGCQLVAVEHTPNQVKRLGETVCSFLTQYLAKRVVLLTENYAEELRARFRYHYHPDKVVVIPNGIDTDFFRPRLTSRSPSKVLRLGMAARFSSTKRQDLLVRMLHSLRSINVTLDFAGSGEQESIVHSLVQELELTDRVRFHGMLPESDLVEFFWTLDILLHASEGETMSTSIMQGLSCGLPVVASDIPGIRNLLEARESIGVLVENTTSAFAHAVVRLGESAKQMEILGSNARKFACEQLTVERAWSSYQQALLP